MIYLITDTHIGHRMMTSSGLRPEGYEKFIIDNWQNQVQVTDTVIHLGDVAFGNKHNHDVIPKLPGRKILIRGNHDNLSTLQYMSCGYDVCCEELGLKLYGVRILLTHRPKYGHAYDINIHGHQHDLHRQDFSRLYLPLCLEQMGYKLLALDEQLCGTIKSWLDRRHIPALEEIRALGQAELPVRNRDLYGGHHGGSSRDIWQDMVKRRAIAEALTASARYIGVKAHPAYCATMERYVQEEISEVELQRRLGRMAREMHFTAPKFPTTLLPSLIV